VAPGQEQRAKIFGLWWAGRKGGGGEEAEDKDGREWNRMGIDSISMRCDAMQCNAMQCDGEQKEMRTRFDEMLYHIASLHLREGMRSNQNPS
jgi:hypothetical protein